MRDIRGTEEGYDGKTYVEVFVELKRDMMDLHMRGIRDPRMIGEGYSGVLVQ